MSLRGPWGRIGLLALLLVASPLTPAAQDPPSDAALRAASRSRAIAVGSATGSRPVSRVPLEVYVARVLAGEAKPSAPSGALEAHAVAIRTFALANAGRHRREGFDLCDSTHCQVLRTATPGTRHAAHATAGRVLTHGGAIVEVLYSASCGGRSEDASALWSGRSFPYLMSIVDDVHDGDEPWTLRLTFDEIRRRLARHGFSGSRLTGFEVESRTVSQRVARIRLTGLRPDLVSGEQFRSVLGPTVVRSTAFGVRAIAGGVELVGRGYGHGVGMCVIGAGRRARRGDDASAILSFYYPGLALTDLDRLRPPAPAEAVEGLDEPAPDAFDAMVARVSEDLGARLGVAASGITVRLHTSMEGYRTATRRPWWESGAARGTAIDLAPAAVLEQRSGLEFALRQAVAGVLVREVLAGRSVWTRVGASRYFARSSPPEPPASRVRCPADAELEASVSAPAFRDAEARAEACFAEALARAGDWRMVR